MRSRTDTQLTISGAAVRDDADSDNRQQLGLVARLLPLALLRRWPNRSLRFAEGPVSRAETVPSLITIMHVRRQWRESSGTRARRLFHEAAAPYYSLHTIKSASFRFRARHSNAIWMTTAISGSGCACARSCVGTRGAVAFTCSLGQISGRWRWAVMSSRCRRKSCRRWS
jgi:hypothetical protein